MKHDITGYSDEARVLVVERYILARLKSRHHGKGEAIAAADLARYFKLRDLPAMYADKERKRRLPEHMARLAYFGELLRAGSESLRARALTQQITQECEAPVESSP